jgi:hypothetical protein
MMAKVQAETCCYEMKECLKNCVDGYIPGFNCLSRDTSGYTQT